MSQQTKIEWTDATWNPVTGCSVLSPGCTNCYAMKLAGTRLRNHPSRAGLTVDSKAGPVWNGQVRFNREWLTHPMEWKRPRNIFVCAHGDLFHENVPDEWIDQVFAVMALCPQHTFQVLTKRAARMREYCSKRAPGLCIAGAMGELLQANASWALKRFLDTKNPAHWDENGDAKCTNFAWPLPNVWLGVSAERQQEADERIPLLLQTPTAVRFVSLEPLLGPISIRSWNHSYGCGCGWGGDNPLDYCNNCGWKGDAPLIECSAGDIIGDCPECNEPLSDYNACPECDGHDGDGMSFGPNHLPKLDWVIVGGESGPAARPMNTAWARSLRDQCAAAGVPFFFKQWGEWLPWSQFGAAAAVEDDPEGTSFATREWDGECWKDVGHPIWCDTADGNIDDEHCVGRVGKHAAGRLLDGVEHNAMPARSAA